MSKSEQLIALIGTPDSYNIQLMELASTWSDIEFVQQAVAQLPSIETIEREFDRTDVEFVQQAVGQLPSIEAIERELQGIDGGDA